MSSIISALSNTFFPFTSLSDYSAGLYLVILENETRPRLGGVRIDNGEKIIQISKCVDNGIQNKKIIFISKIEN